MLTLYADSLWESPWVFTVFVGLVEKGLSFEERSLDLGRGDQRDPAYRRASVTARVPALDHDGFVLAESMAIVEYLEEVFPPPQHPRLWPADQRARARARQIVSWLRSDVAAVREERPTTTMFYARAAEPLSPAARAAADKLIGVADALVTAEDGFLFSDGWSVADADLAFALHRLILNGDPVPARVRRWAERQWGRSSVQRFVQHDRPARGG